MITIRATGPSAEEEIRSLFAWLNDEADVRQHTRISLSASQPGVGEMGAALDVIQLVTDSTFQILNLALAYANWRTSRPTRTRVTIERKGVKVQLDETDDEAVRKIVRALR